MKTELYQSPWTVFKSRQGFASFGIALLFVWIWFHYLKLNDSSGPWYCSRRLSLALVQTRSINESCHAEKKFLVCCEWYNDNAWNGIPWFLMFPIEVWIDFSVSQGLCTVSQIKNHLNVICFEVLQNSRFGPVLSHHDFRLFGSISTLSPSCNVWTWTWRILHRITGSCWRFFTDSHIHLQLRWI